jgi:hypothetical protein
MESTRFFKRVIFRQKIEASTQDGLFCGTSENISLGGMFIRTEKTLAPGDEIIIDIPLKTELANARFSATLTALRKEPCGVAFKFRDLDPKNFWTLQSFINMAIAA